MVNDSDLFLVNNYNPLETIKEFDIIGRSIKNIYLRDESPEHPINKYNIDQAIPKTYPGGVNLGFFKLKYHSSGFDKFPIIKPKINGINIINSFIMNLSI
jgi:hypothetical protein